MESIAESLDRFNLLKGCSFPGRLVATFPLAMDEIPVPSHPCLTLVIVHFCVSHPCGYQCAFLYCLKVQMICRYFLPLSGLLIPVSGTIRTSHFKSLDDVLLIFRLFLVYGVMSLKKKCLMKTKNTYGFVFF